MTINYCQFLKIVLLAFLIVSCNTDYYQKTKSLQTHLENQKSIQYDIDYGIKYFDHDDTTKVKTSVTLIRDSSDIVFGGVFWYTIKDTTRHLTKYYDLTQLYVIDHNLKNVIAYNTLNAETWPITGATDGEVINTYFLKPQRLEKLIDSSKNTVRFKKQQDKIKVEILFPDDDEVFNQNKSILINPELIGIDQINYEAHLDFQVQYNKWKLYNTAYNTTTPEDLKLRFDNLTKGFVSTKYKSQSKADLQPLSSGLVAPDLNGRFFNSSEDFNLKDYKGKIVILDFWYRSCPPCIKAIPSLNKIAEDYKDKEVVVLGINPIDIQASKKNKLQEFISYHKVSYPTILVDRQAVQPYNIQVYPTLYIINKNGEIAYSKLGLDESDEVSQLLESLTQK